jgi:ABC-type uncharacterized transport system permease subunit
LWVPLIAFFFSVVLNGSITLQLKTQLHSSLGGILTGVMVLFVLLFGSPQQLGIGGKREAVAGPEVIPAEELSPPESISTEVKGGD